MDSFFCHRRHLSAPEKSKCVIVKSTRRLMLQTTATTTENYYFVIFVAIDTTEKYAFVLRQSIRPWLRVRPFVGDFGFVFELKVAVVVGIRQSTLWTNAIIALFISIAFVWNQ